jgi:hypothetical protein
LKNPVEDYFGQKRIAMLEDLRLQHGSLASHEKTADMRAGGYGVCSNF